MEERREETVRKRKDLPYSGKKDHEEDIGEEDEEKGVEEMAHGIGTDADGDVAPKDEDLLENIGDKINDKIDHEGEKKKGDLCLFKERHAFDIKGTERRNEDISERKQKLFVRKKHADEDEDGNRNRGGKRSKEKDFHAIGRQKDGRDEEDGE